MNAWTHGEMHGWNGLEDGYSSVDGEGKWVHRVNRWVDTCKGGCTGERMDEWVDE